MAANNPINFKAFLLNPDLVEIRRFTVDVSVVTNFMFLKEKLQTIFPLLKNSTFKITYKDKDGDGVTISSDEELISALMDLNDNVKKIFVELQRNHDEEMARDFVFDFQFQPPMPSSHSRVICDGCQNRITEIRYKCMECPDYDLCEGCEHKGLHYEHSMMRMAPDDWNFGKCGRKFFKKHGCHPGFKKDFCKRGQRFNQERGHCPATSFCSQIKPEHIAEFGNMFSKMFTCPKQEGAPATPNNSAEEKPATKESTEATNAQEGNATSSSSPCPSLADLVNHFLNPLQQQQQEQQQTSPADKKPEESSTNGAQTPKPINMADIISHLLGAQNAPENGNPAQNSATPQMNVADLVNQFFGAHAPNQPEPSKQTSRGAQPEDWTFVPSTSSGTPNAGTPPTTEGQVPLRQDPVIAAGLNGLREMGFSQASDYLTKLLEKNNGNVGKTVEDIMNNRS